MMSTTNAIKIKRIKESERKLKEDSWSVGGDVLESI